MVLNRCWIAPRMGPTTADAGHEGLPIQVPIPSSVDPIGGAINLSGLAELAALVAIEVRHLDRAPLPEASVHAARPWVGRPLPSRPAAPTYTRPATIFASLTSFPWTSLSRKAG